MIFRILKLRIAGTQIIHHEIAEQDVISSIRDLINLRQFRTLACIFLALIVKTARNRKKSGEVPVGNW